MNKIVLTGYIASEVELRRTQSGKAVTTFRFAVRRPMTKEKTDFHTCVAWESTAEFIQKYFSKGSGAEVIGYLVNRDYTDRDGNKRYATEVNIQEIDFGKSTGNKSEGKRRESEPSESGNSYSGGNDYVGESNYGEYGDYGEIDDDDEQLPF